MNRWTFDPKERLVYVTVDLFGPRGPASCKFALDVGSTLSTVSERVLPQLGIDPRGVPQTLRVNAYRSSERAGRVTLARLSALGRTVERPTLICAPLNPRSGIDGLLGLDFFRGQVLTLDFARGRISLGPPRTWWPLW